MLTQENDPHNAWFPYGTFKSIPSPVQATQHGLRRSSSKVYRVVLLLPIFLLIFLVLATSSLTSIQDRDARRLSVAKAVAEDQPSPKSPPRYQYGVMMDLGSSGSRLYVYRWLPALPLRSIIQLGLVNTNPGVSWYVSTDLGPNADQEGPLRVATSLLPLISFAKTLVPFTARATTPIRAKCTAGCRALDGPQSQTVLKGVRRVLADSGFEFRPSYVEEMSGEMEAILDWVSINAALGLLHQPTYYQSQNQLFMTPTVGVMDIGGGSAQIAYSALSTAIAPPPTAKPTVLLASAQTLRPVVFGYGRGLFHLRLVNGVEHTVYAVSRIHYGMHDAQKLVISNDVDGTGSDASPPRKWSPDDPPVTHPCVQRGVYLTTKAGTGVTGTGVAEACLRTVQNFFKDAEEHDLANVSQALPAPSFNLPFLPFAAMNNFYRLHQFALKALSNVHHGARPTTAHSPMPPHQPGGPFDVNSLMRCLSKYPIADANVFFEAAKVVCPLDFAELQLQYGTLLDAERLRDACFGLVLMKVLLSQVYEFAKNQHFHPMHATKRCPGLALPDIDTQFPAANLSDTVAEKNLQAMYSSSWTLGGMVLEMEGVEQDPLGP